jgi:hypothetical protein
MPFLGTIVPANLHVAKIGRKPARLPIVVYAGEPQRLLGVAVVYDPSYLGDPLVAQLEAEGYQGPFSLASVGGLSVGEKHAAAVAIDTAEDPDLNVAETLATFGYDVKRARR